MKERARWGEVGRRESSCVELQINSSKIILTIIISLVLFVQNQIKRANKKKVTI
jgi:hypothetical protein